MHWLFGRRRGFCLTVDGLLLSACIALSSSLSSCLIGTWPEFSPGSIPMEKTFQTLQAVWPAGDAFALIQLHALHSIKTYQDCVCEIQHTAQA